MRRVADRGPRRDSAARQLYFARGWRAHARQRLSQLHPHPSLAFNGLARATKPPPSHRPSRHVARPRDAARHHLMNLRLLPWSSLLYLRSARAAVTPAHPALRPPAPRSGSPTARARGSSERDERGSRAGRGAPCQNLPREDKVDGQQHQHRGENPDLPSPPARPRPQRGVRAQRRWTVRTAPRAHAHARRGAGGSGGGAR